MPGSIWFCGVEEVWTFFAAPLVPTQCYFSATIKRAEVEAQGVTVWAAESDCSCIPAPPPPSTPPSRIYFCGLPAVWHFFDHELSSTTCYYSYSLSRIDVMSQGVDVYHDAAGCHCVPLPPPAPNKPPPPPQLPPVTPPLFPVVSNLSPRPSACPTSLPPTIWDRIADPDASQSITARVASSLPSLMAHEFPLLPSPIPEATSKSEPLHPVLLADLLKSDHMSAPVVSRLSEESMLDRLLRLGMSSTSFLFVCVGLICLTRRIAVKQVIFCAINGRRYLGPLADRRRLVNLL